MISSLTGSKQVLDKVVICGVNLWICVLTKQAGVIVGGAIGGPLFGLFSLGILCPFANTIVSSPSVLIHIFIVHPRLQ